MAKLDLQAAFHMVPILPSEWELLGMRWRDQYYVDTCLPLSLCSAPSIFNNFASALHWFLEHNYGATPSWSTTMEPHPPGAQLWSHTLLEHNYGATPSWSTTMEPHPPGAQLWSHTLLEHNYGATPSWSTTMEPHPPGAQLWSHTLLHYLDSTLQQLWLPLAKLQAITSLTKSWLGKRSVTKRQLLPLIGQLSFAAKAVPAGHLFLHCLFHLSITVRRLHHRTRLNADARADVEWWDHFLPSWKDVAMFIAPD